MEYREYMSDSTSASLSSSPRVFGQITSFGAGRVNGLDAANRNFIKSVIEHGEFDEFHFFMAGKARVAFEREYAETAAGVSRSIRVRLFTFLDIPRLFAQTRYAAFHAGDAYIQHVAWLRKAYAPAPFPITGAVNTLSTDPSMGDFLNLLCAPVLPCDAMISSSKAGKEALLHIFAALGRRSEGGGAVLPKSFIGKLPVIPHGVDEARFHPVTAEERAELRSAFNLPLDKPVVLALGRISLNSKMDLFPLIEAFTRVDPKGEAVLLIAGAVDGEQEYLWRLLQRGEELGLKDRLKIQLNFKDEDKAALYQACDVFVSPADNLQETFGLAPVEAMACGVPVVLSDWSGYRELITDGDEGFLAPTYWGGCDEEIGAAAFFDPVFAHTAFAQSVAVDRDVLVNRLSRLLGDGELRETMGRAARERAVKRFAASKIPAQYNALWRELGVAAERINWTGPSGRHGFLPYCEVFRHFAAKRIEDGALVVMTERGMRAVDGGESVFMPEAMESLLSFDLVARVIELSAEAVKAGELRKKLSDIGNVEYHLLWMLKRGLIKLVSL